MDKKFDTKRDYRVEELCSVLDINLSDLTALLARGVLHYEYTADGLEISGADVLKYLKSKKSCTPQDLH